MTVRTEERLLFLISRIKKKIESIPIDHEALTLNHKEILERIYKSDLKNDTPKQLIFKELAVDNILFWIELWEDMDS